MEFKNITGMNNWNITKIHTCKIARIKAMKYKDKQNVTIKD